MAIKVNVIKCPQCGADLPFEEGKKQMFCSYCGSKIVITNENEYVHRHINETGVKWAETVQKLGIKKMELDEKRLAAAEKKRAFKIKLSIPLAIVSLVFLGIGFTTEGSFALIMMGAVAAAILVAMWQ